MSVITKLHDLASEMAAEFKTLKQKIAGNISGDLSGLATTAKTSVVASVNEVITALAGRQPLIGFTPENVANKGAANGYASLDANAKVPAAQLPSFVDDVEEYPYLMEFPATGRQSVIYIDMFRGKTYRWSGTGYVEISQNLALGETSESAIRGDWGKAAYDHSQITSANPHSTAFDQLVSKPFTVPGYGITDLYRTPDIGTPTTDFVANFEAALV